MLVLSRKVGELIQIGDNITIRLTRITGERASVGIEAPPELRILRGELESFSANGVVREAPDRDRH